MTDAGGATPVAELIASLTRRVPDFPKPGIHFKDLTPLFADATAMTAVTGALARHASGADLVAGIDSRGFLVAAARLLRRTGATVTAAAVVFELGALGGRAALAPLPVHSLTCQ
ncbi:adenine phosphoribosyltransferase [Mycobacterium lepraemurium]|nr:hypothetical protein [Mycobacterium lepraemurium]ATA28229.1 adenine phosphoribosyltransferase [Mycobacterium lepraemurium]